jgi:nucleoside-diphosphate-sugar epimerase
LLTGCGVTGQVGSAVARYLDGHNDVVGVAPPGPGDQRSIDDRYPGTAAQPQ